MKKFLILSIVLAFAVGCASAPQTAKIEPIKGAPDWVYKPLSAFNDGNIYGVGMARGISSKSLLISTADNRAKANLASTMKTYVAYMAEDYERSTSAGDKELYEQDVTNTIKSFTNMELSGAVVVDRWQDPSDGTLYALVKLDRQLMDDYMGEKTLSREVAEKVRENSAAAMDRLAAEEDRAKTR
jgi:predicted transglutaminase-like cysteine proteinase